MGAAAGTEGGRAARARAAPPQGGGGHGRDVLDVLVVGAGFGGLGTAALLDRAGFGSLLVLEAADDVGGTWRENTYPGCACDIPAPLYSFSFAQNPHWERLFARQPEILGHLRDLARRHRLTGRIRFGARVTAAAWDETAAHWRVTTADGREFRARFLVTAVGTLHHPAVPDLPGAASFAGPAFHSARWDHGVDLAGKHVVVVGTGASAVQFVPAIVDEVSRLTVFQRTPPWVLPKADRTFGARHRRLARWFPPYRWYVRGRLFRAHEKRAAGFVTDPAALAGTAALARRHLARQVPDPALRDLLTPDYALGCKRLLISGDWYPALTREHVSVRGGGVREVRPDGVVGDDGAFTPADVLIYGTGFEAHGNVARLEITGRGGVRLADAWRDGDEAYLGTTVAGFPNMFVVFGPNTGLGHNSQLFMIEAQARHIVSALRRVRRAGAASLEVRAEAQRRFTGWVRERLARTVWESGGCRSWYQDPRTGRNTVLWPDTALAFRRRVRRARGADYVLRPARNGAGPRGGRRRATDAHPFALGVDGPDRREMCSGHSVRPRRPRDL